MKVKIKENNSCLPVGQTSITPEKAQIASSSTMLSIPLDGATQFLLSLIAITTWSSNLRRFLNNRISSLNENVDLKVKINLYLLRAVFTNRVRDRHF